MKHGKVARFDQFKSDEPVTVTVRQGDRRNEAECDYVLMAFVSGKMEGDVEVGQQAYALSAGSHKPERIGPAFGTLFGAMLDVSPTIVELVIRQFLERDFETTATAIGAALYNHAQHRRAKHGQAEGDSRDDAGAEGGDGPRSW